MVVRDRSRPSVIMWGTRLNESGNAPILYQKTHRLAHELDDSRPTTGTTLRHSTTGWIEDVFGFDDYHGSAGTAQLLPPLPGVPYLISETVGALDGPPTFRWTDPATLTAQARLHAQVHHLAGTDPRYAGVLGWAGIDYASLNGGKRSWNALKTPGVLDTFRIAKPGAAFYRSQIDPETRPVVLPVFFWDTGSPDGPGAEAMIATNCDRLEIYVGGRHLTTATPDTTRFGGLRYPPAFADLRIDVGVRPDLVDVGVRPDPVDGTGPAGLPDLRIDGYLGARKVITTLMSADTTLDRLELVAEDTTIQADGHDATLVTFRAVDAYGNHRPSTTGHVTLALTGPATLVADNPFPFDRYGAAGGALIRSRPGSGGPIRLTAQHPSLGSASVQLTATMPSKLDGDPTP
jgi:beta-galactosidase